MNLFEFGFVLLFFGLMIFFAVTGRKATRRNLREIPAPYSNRDEAWKFLSLLQDLDGMRDSYISQVTRQKWTN